MRDKVGKYWQKYVGSEVPTARRGSGPHTTRSDYADLFLLGYLRSWGPSLSAGTVVRTATQIPTNPGVEPGTYYVYHPQEPPLPYLDKPCKYHTSRQKSLENQH